MFAVMCCVYFDAFLFLSAPLHARVFLAWYTSLGRKLRHYLKCTRDKSHDFLEFEVFFDQHFPFQLFVRTVIFSINRLHEVVDGFVNVRLNFSVIVWNALQTLQQQANPDLRRSLSLWPNDNVFRQGSTADTHVLKLSVILGHNARWSQKCYRVIHNHIQSYMACIAHDSYKVSIANLRHLSKRVLRKR